MAEPKQPHSINIKDEISGGEYSNAMQILHNKDEFQIFFLNIMGINGKVVGKIMTSPGHLKRMLSAINENLKHYEVSFGAVAEAVSPMEKEVGFKTDK